jgi:hypothetical protein
MGDLGIIQLMPGSLPPVSSRSQQPILILALLLTYVLSPQPKRSNSTMLSLNISIFYVILVSFTIFTCSPHSASWGKLVSGHCFKINAVLLSAATFNVVSDIIILALP